MIIVESGAETSLFAAADIHALDGQSRFSAVLSLVKEDKSAVQPKVVLLGGDYVGGGRPPVTEEERLKRWQPVFRLADVRREIVDAFGDDVKTYFTYGSHDKNEISAGRDFFCGPADCGGYYLYGISFSQMRYAAKGQLIEDGYDGPDADSPLGGSAKEAARHFSEWASSLNDGRTIFVMSHLPLHVHRGDNRGADIWCCALNHAAARHNIFVFFAHNHSTERRTDYDRAFYLIPPGGVMPVQGAEREDSRDVRLKFTYLNAGYILHGCGTLLTLSDSDGDGRYDKVYIRRYAVDAGETAFGNTKEASPYVGFLNHHG